MVGRAAIVVALEADALAGHTVVVHGPWGIGKSAIFDEIERRLTTARHPCGKSDRTATLRDVTDALARAYPDVPIEGRPQRHVRAALRLAVERRPGVLMLDHLIEAGGATKAFLRSLAGPDWAC